MYVANEGFTPESAEQVVASGEADAVAFGKLFIANPDLPARIAKRAALNAWRADRFYFGGPGRIRGLSGAGRGISLQTA